MGRFEVQVQQCQLKTEGEGGQQVPAVNTARLLGKQAAKSASPDVELLRFCVLEGHEDAQKKSW